MAESTRMQELAEAGVTPEREDGERFEMLGHGVDQRHHDVEVDERPLGTVGLAGAADATGIARHELVGDRGVEDGA